MQALSPPPLQTDCAGCWPPTSLRNSDLVAQSAPAAPASRVPHQSGCRLIQASLSRLYNNSDGGLLVARRVRGWQAVAEKSLNALYLKGSCEGRIHRQPYATRPPSHCRIFRAIRSLPGSEPSIESQNEHVSSAVVEVKSPLSGERVLCRKLISHICSKRSLAPDPSIVGFRITIIMPIKICDRAQTQRLLRQVTYGISSQLLLGDKPVSANGKALPVS
jgi:hypothetical protein